MGSQKMRVVSLLPSSTDTALALGKEGLLVGRSHECDDSRVRHVPVVTEPKLGDCESSRAADAAMASASSALSEAALWGAPQCLLLEYGISVYKADVEKLKELKPDVILTQLQGGHGSLVFLDDLREALESCLGFAPIVVHSDPMDLAGVWRDMESIANALGAAEEGKGLVAGLKRRMEEAAAAASGRARVPVACIQWFDPIYTAGGWVPELIRMAGGDDTLGRGGGGATLVDGKDLIGSGAKVMLFALCGYSLNESLKEVKSGAERLAGWRDIPAVRAGRVAVFDARRLFSRPGPFLADTVESLVEVLHGEAQPFGHGERGAWCALEALPVATAS